MITTMKTLLLTLLVTISLFSFTHAFKFKDLTPFVEFKADHHGSSSSHGQDSSALLPTMADPMTDFTGIRVLADDHDHHDFTGMDLARPVHLKNRLCCRHHRRACRLNRGKNLKTHRLGKIHPVVAELIFKWLKLGNKAKPKPQPQPRSRLSWTEGGPYAHVSKRRHTKNCLVVDVEEVERMMAKKCPHLQMPCQHPRCHHRHRRNDDHHDRDQRAEIKRENKKGEHDDQREMMRVEEKHLDNEERRMGVLNKIRKILPYF